jgi:hypothetical protein
VQLFGLSVLIDVWARRNPPNVVITKMADYGARKPLIYLNIKLFVRLRQLLHALLYLLHPCSRNPPYAIF